MIAGLESISAGTVSIDGKVVNAIGPTERDIAMVFQNYALYPHMNVYDNMAYGLRNRGTPKDEIDRRVRQTAATLELSALLDRRPRQLSGGQRQRVAMGRAIVRNPKVFLFDEPLSNLDAKLRGQMRVEIKNLQRALGVTSVYVTHDQLEAMTLADLLVVMNAGLVEQSGNPLDIYEKPASTFVASFIGAPPMNLLAVTPGDNGFCVRRRLGGRRSTWPEKRGDLRFPPRGRRRGVRTRTCRRARSRWRPRSRRWSRSGPRASSTARRPATASSCALPAARWQSRATACASSSRPRSCIGSTPAASGFRRRPRPARRPAAARPGLSAKMNRAARR